MIQIKPTPPPPIHGLCPLDSKHKMKTPEVSKMAASEASVKSNNKLRRSVQWETSASKLVWRAGPIADEREAGAHVTRMLDRGA